MRGRPRERFSDRARYAVDNALARGLWVIMMWMAAALVVSVVLVGLMIWAFGAGPEDRPVPLAEGIWIALTRSLDPGTFGQDDGPHFRFAGLVITVVGLLAIALLIGLIASAVDRRLLELRQGRSIVLESDHTLVLGHSSKLPLVARELVIANASSPRRAIVILTPSDKVELEQVLKREVPRSPVRLVVRRGEPSSLVELSQGRPELARNIIILRQDETDADAEVVKVALAVCKARQGLPRIPIIAELQDSDVARGLRQALPGQVITVVQSEVVARVAAQASRAAGLGTLYQDLLDFDGDELYLAPMPPALIGRAFGDALLASDNCAVLGVLSSAGQATLCPSLDRVLAADDLLVLIANDDSEVGFQDQIVSLTAESGEGLVLRPPIRERLLIIGWNAIAARIASEIDQHVAPGSELHVLVDPHTAQAFADADLTRLQNQEVQVRRGSMIDRSAIAAALDGGPYDHILVLCPHQGLSPLQADARSLLAVLHIRNVMHERGEEVIHANVVTEVMTGESVDLAQVAQPDDYIVSQRLVSLLMSQLAEDDRRKPVIHELLDSHGAQLLLYPAEDAGLQGAMTFRQIIEHMLPMGVIAIGWRAASYLNHPAALRGGMRVNPRKEEAVTLVPGDDLILLRHG